MTDSPTHRLRTLLAKLRRVDASQLNARGPHNAGGLPPCVPIYLFDFFLKIKKRLPTPLIFLEGQSANRHGIGARPCQRRVGHTHDLIGDPVGFLLVEVAGCADGKFCLDSRFALARGAPAATGAGGFTLNHGTTEN